MKISYFKYRENILMEENILIFFRDKCFFFETICNAQKNTLCKKMKEIFCRYKFRNNFKKFQKILIRETLHENFNLLASYSFRVDKDFNYTNNPCQGMMSIICHIISAIFAQGRVRGRI